MDVSQELTGGAGAPGSPAGLSIAMTPPGHWHFTHSKRLTFTVTDAAGRPVPGLSAAIDVRTLGGRVDHLRATDHGDGGYSAEYPAWEIGPDYATSYAVLFCVEYQGERYADAWPAEVVRDGREDIFKADGRYLYQVRYGWSPGRPAASDDTPVTFSFEPRRALEEGDVLDRRQPWRHPANHLPDVSATVVVRSSDGLIRDELPASYAGLGVYRAQRVFTPSEVGAGRSYWVSLLFTDPYNQQTLGEDDNAYRLDIRDQGEADTSGGEPRHLGAHTHH